MSAIYRILSEQNLENLDLSNKQASVDVLSFTESSTMRLRNRHRIYRKHECIWCGSDLGVAGSKTGKVKVSCGDSCGQSYRLFMQRLEVILSSNDYPKRLQIFVVYCLIQMIFRVPAKRLNEQLKNASKWKPTIQIPVQQKRKQKP